MLVMLVMRRIVGSVKAFLEGYRSHMVYPRTSRLMAVRVGLYHARTYLHNTSRRWPGCRCEMHRKDSHRYNPLDR